ncbi:hypothetical protein D3C75_549410 [compost metagenome]
MSRSPGKMITDLATLMKDLVKEGNEQERYELSVVTPMFGGGYKTGEIDQLKPIRESTIRGQLRFWWRATRGAVFGNASELRKREAEIFGDTLNPSQVIIQVSDVEAESVIWYTPGEKKSFIPQYLFQLSKDRDGQVKKISYISQCTFKLQIQWSLQAKRLAESQLEAFQELQLDVRAALWAWVNFGGLGSRTRRGCGSLYCKGISPTMKEVSDQGFQRWFDQNIQKYHLVLLPTGQSREWPTLSGQFRISTQTKETSKNWNDVIMTYRSFRRRANIRRPIPGRSFWPEADSIRYITQFSHPDHKLPFPNDKSKQLKAFPRGQFGLPIIFEFKKKSSQDQTRKESEIRNRRRWEKEPDTTMLVSENGDRLASPVILKALSYDPKASIGIIIVLNHPELKKVLLKKNSGEKSEILERFSQNEIYPELTYRDNPLQDSEGNHYTSAVAAFLNSKEVEHFCNPANPKIT